MHMGAPRGSWIETDYNHNFFLKHNQYETFKTSIFRFERILCVTR